MALTPVERKQLRARAHALKPVVLVGDAGVSAGVLAEADRALHDHELIKIRLPGVDRDARREMADTLCAQLNAEDVQSIGRVQVLFRPRPEQPGKPEKARQPSSGKARPRGGRGGQR